MTSTMTAAQAEILIERHRDAVLAIPGVVGIGIGGADNDAVVHILQSGELASTSSDMVQRLFNDAPVLFIGFSTPQADDTNP